MIFSMIFICTTAANVAIAVWAHNTHAAIGWLVALAYVYESNRRWCGLK